jgi:hypothetical protein
MTLMAMMCGRQPPDVDLIMYILWRNTTVLWPGASYRFAYRRYSLSPRQRFGNFPERTITANTRWRTTRFRQTQEKSFNMRGGVSDELLVEFQKITEMASTLTRRGAGTRRKSRTMERIDCGDEKTT